MKTNAILQKCKRRGSVLVLSLIFLTVTMLILASALGWTMTSSRLTGRNVEYYRTEAAAEAATEKVIAALNLDYEQLGEAEVLRRLDTYRALVPTTNEDSAWRSYAFMDIQGNRAHTTVDYIPPSQYRVLGSQYEGLSGYASSFRVISNVRQTDGPFNITGGLLQDIDVATIPLFQFAIFYNIELEINPSPPMSVTGPVHGNTNIYIAPANVLTFQSAVSSAAQIIMTRDPNDPSGVGSGGGVVNFAVKPKEHMSSLTMPIGTNSNPSAVRQIIEIPPTSESPTSSLGRERFYNKADMVVLVSDSGIVARSGQFNNFATLVPSNEVAKFITLTNFYNKREGKTIKATQLDIAKLRVFNTNLVTTANNLRPVIPTHDITIVYVADQRTQSSSTESGVRLVNGQTLLPLGLTVATPNPLYVLGHYNVATNALGTTNTINTFPAALIADAITVLSVDWRDANSTLALGSRVAANTTVNAAFLAGVVPTSRSSYSGGVENFPRFLEDWSGQILTYNGSMVVMYDSKVATGLWQGTGATIGIYNPPVRRWAFDQNFNDVKKQPPGTPSVRALIRGRWAMIKPGTSG
jgi:hypothetical protein